MFGYSNKEADKENVADILHYVTVYLGVWAERLTNPRHKNPGHLKILGVKRSWNLDGKTQAASLIFRGPCIAIYFFNKSQWDALFLKFI